MPTPAEIDQLLRPVLLKDLRVILRVRGINPAGGKEHLELLLKEHMLATGDFSLRQEEDFTAYSALGSASEKSLASDRTNNYSRPGGQQNVGNHMTGRNSSRVTAPPGGASQISFGDAPPQQAQQHYNQQGPPPDQYAQYQQQPPPQQYQGGPPPQQYGGGGGGGYGGAPDGYGGPPPQQQQQQYSGPGQPGGGGNSPAPGQGSANNNYSRPNGMQNVGNFLTDRPSSRVLAPPGGKSQISFG